MKRNAHNTRKVMNWLGINTKEQFEEIRPILAKASSLPAKVIDRMADQLPESSTKREPRDDES